MPDENVTSQTTPQAVVQENAPQVTGEVASVIMGQGTPETTAQKLAKGFAQMSGAISSKAEPAQAEAQEQPETATGQEQTVEESQAPNQAKPEAEMAKGSEKGKGEAQLSEEEKRRRAEQSAGDRARHQQELEAQRQKQRAELEKRRKDMLGLDDELLGQEARRQLEAQALQEQIVAQIRPQIEQEVHTNTRVIVASELIATLGDEALQNQVLARSTEWQSPADFYAAYNRAVADKAIEEFKQQQLPKLLNEARNAGRNEAHSVDEETPLPQLDGGTTPSRAYRTAGERLQAGLDQMRRRR